MSEFRQLRVFLCHASQDKPIVRDLYGRLSKEGWIEPWLDEEKLLPGMVWHVEIEKAVEKADAVIVCVSSTSVNKEGYIQRELSVVLDIALTKPRETIFVIPLRLDDCEPPRTLRSWQYADYFPEDRREWAYGKLLESLRARALALGFELSADVTPISESSNKGSEDKKFVMGLGLDKLTEKELEILVFLADSMSNQEIADKLSLRIGTVRNYVSSIFLKLGVSNRTEAAVYAQNLPLQISNQEQQILLLLCEGLTNKEIAARLSLKDGTVRNYVSGMLTKFGFSRRSELAVYATKRYKKSKSSDQSNHNDS